MKRLYFDSDKAYEFLMIHNYVFTLRAQKPNTPRAEKVKLWRKGRALPPRAMKVLVGDYFDGDLLKEGILTQYMVNSGFDTAEDWYAEALRLSGNNDEWSLFYVHLLGVF